MGEGSPNGNSPLVSIVIPCFNGETTIAEAIDSALGQSCSNIEVIVVDDGSTDRSLDVIRSFGERIVWRTGLNRGACAARNTGLNVSRGVYVQFLDADDVLAPDKVADQVALMESAGEGVAFVAGSYVFEKFGGAVIVGLDQDAIVQDPISWILGGRKLGITSANLWCAACLKAVGGWREGLPAGQESELMLRLLTRGYRCAVDNGAKTIVRQQADSIGRQAGGNRPQAVKSWIDVRASHVRSLAKSKRLTKGMIMSYARFIARHHASRPLSDPVSVHVLETFQEISRHLGGGFRIFCLRRYFAKVGRARRDRRTPLQFFFWLTLFDPSMVIKILAKEALLHRRLVASPR